MNLPFTPKNTYGGDIESEFHSTNQMSSHVLLVIDILQAAFKG